MTAVTVRVPAKVNLQLSVGPRRDDGYHDLVNVFHAVSLFDEVTARQRDGVLVRVTGEQADQVPVDGGNLAVRAALALGAAAGVPADVELTIAKKIPVAGGMAGGSADAAAALVACNELWKCGASRSELLGLAADLGSDVPFALVGGTAVGLGRGERLTPAPSTGTFHWVFAQSAAGLSTATVYRECDRLRAADGVEAGWPQPDAELMAALRAGDPRSLGAALTNDLQAAALSLRPALGQTLAAGLEHGALGALVSGSGPTVAFLAASAAHAAELAAAVAGSAQCRGVVRADGPVAGATVIDP